MSPHLKPCLSYMDRRVPSLKEVKEGMVAAIPVKVLDWLEEFGDVMPP
jgi:hypothetical protein